MSIHNKKNELKFWLAINKISAIGPIRFRRLFDYFTDLENAWTASFNEILKAGIEEKIANQFINERRNISPNFELEKLEKLNAKAITIADSYYPKLLKEIYAPPPLLYFLGSLDFNNDFLLAIVGTRKISGYGRQATEQITKEIVCAKMAVVSGLALGVDACAQQTTLNFGGKTIAVLGSGIDKIYPASNRQLAEKIVEKNGAIISEFAPGTLPYKSNFPQRNRIISGLSLGTLVIEASQKSGALITAKYALEQNREVFAVPGNIFSINSLGPNDLIKRGAKVVTCASDILEALNLEQANDYKIIKKIIPENENEKKLLELIGNEPVHVDKITQYARLDISCVNSTLSIMEMKGMIKNLGNQKYILAR